MSSSPSSSTSSSPSSLSPNFSTKDLQVAAYLIATAATTKIKFIGCKIAGNGRREVFFLFDDPDNQGDDLELDYESGATANALALFQSLKFLRRKMTATLEGSREGRERRFEGREGPRDGSR